MPDESQANRRKYDYVPWFIFAWSIGIASVLFLGLYSLYSSLSSRLQVADEARQQISVQLSAIQVNLQNLDARLTEIRNDINRIK